MHPVDALPDADAFAGLLIAFVLEQQACGEEQRGDVLSDPMGGVRRTGLGKEADNIAAAAAVKGQQKFQSC